MNFITKCADKQRNTALLLFASLVIQLPAKAEITSNCMKEALFNVSVFRFTSGKLVATREYQGTKYHLIFLQSENSKRQPIEVILREQPARCDLPVFDSAGHRTPYDDVIPAAVTKPLYQQATQFWQQQK